MNLILEKSEKLINEREAFEKKQGTVPDTWKGIATVAAEAIEDAKTFEDAVEPLMKWLAENQHPHTTCIVTSNKAELVEGIKVHMTERFIVD